VRGSGRPDVRQGGNGVRVLYGVNGEGMGHATRSRVVIDALLARHDVRSDSVAATEEALRTLSAEGYEFVSIPELGAEAPA
jgi:Glycosyl transferase family 1